MRVSLPEHIKNYERPKNEIIQIRGPGNSAFLIELMPSKDVYETRFLLKNFILIKHDCRYEDPGISQFERRGYVITKPIEDYPETVKKAIFHVKEIGAEELVENKKAKQLKFLCSPGRIFVTAYKLSMYGYEVESSGIEYCPKYVVGLKGSKKKLCEKFLKVMNQLPNVVGGKPNDQKWLVDGSSFTLFPEKAFSTPPRSVTRSVRQLYSLPDPEGMEWSDSDESDTAVAETPARTELFEVKGPDGSGFLIEVRAEDLQDVRRELNELKGDFFHYDKSVIEWFTIKCLLTAEALPNCSREQQRLARVHAIASGSEEVHKIDGTGNFLFVNSVDRTSRARRILEKLGYKISGIMYRFQPKEKISLDDAFREVCDKFIKAVEELPQVISVTHNV